MFFVPLYSRLIPQNFSEVIHYLVEKNVFWIWSDEFTEFTIGHFAVKTDHGDFFTSYRYNRPEEIIQQGLMNLRKKDIKTPKDCVVHFHCPALPHYTDGETENGILCKFFENHGPNIYFNHDVDSSHIIKFIEDNFDLSKRTTAL